MKINIIIIGAKSSSQTSLNIDNINNYKRWNNSDQAGHSDLVDCIQCLDAKVSVFCIDPLYDFAAEDKENNIVYYNDYFEVGDTRYCTKKGHNIFIEFSNLLDEYYVTKEYCEKITNISKYNNYKMTWISCGCGWSHKFPTELISNVVENHLFTPTDIYDANSLLTAYNFNYINGNALYAPYCQGLYQILGSLLWRGTKENQEYEMPLYDLTPQIMHVFDEPIQQDLSKFLQREIRWNTLHRRTREIVNKTVYGSFITIY
jgi:hypothetical protein